MNITAQAISDSAIECKTEIDGRRYSGKFHGCSIAQARKIFRQRVEVAESKFMDERRQELIDVCLNCQIPVERCKGNCKIRQAIKIKRGKGVK